jgi:hypothetical protein
MLCYAKTQDEWILKKISAFVFILISQQQKEKHFGISQYMLFASDSATIQKRLKFRVLLSS